MIHWSMLIFVPLLVLWTAGLIWTAFQDNKNLTPEGKAVGFLVFGVLLVCTVLIYGGIYWW